MTRDQPDNRRGRLDKALGYVLGAVALLFSVVLFALIWWDQGRARAGTQPAARRR